MRISVIFEAIQSQKQVGDSVRETLAMYDLSIAQPDKSSQTLQMNNSQIPIVLNNKANLENTAQPNITAKSANKATPKGRVQTHNNHLYDIPNLNG